MTETAQKSGLADSRQGRGIAVQDLRIGLTGRPGVDVVDGIDL
jgi:hypothetical protein